MELRRKGVSDEDIKNATEQETWDDETEEDRARDFAERKVRSISTSGDLYKQRQRLVSTMIRRGFPMDISFKLANELVTDTPDDDEDDE
jgi:SOS response regulatory protein OraA/RecX